MAWGEQVRKYKIQDVDYTEKNKTVNRVEDFSFTRESELTSNESK
jgi:hypothetical protein